MKTALVTGANKGIGFELATALLKDGYHVLVGARSVERGQEAVKQLAPLGPVDFVQVDLSDLTVVDQAAATINAQFGELNLLVNNAGISGDMRKAAWEYTPEELMETNHTDFIGPYELTRQLLPTLEKNHGTIVNVTMPIEPQSYFNPLAYLTAKAPLNVMIKSMGLGFKEANKPVSIFGVMPGVISTDLNGNMQGEGVITPAEAAALILSFTTDGQDHNGQVINHDGTVADYTAGSNF
ncbi:SDR family NAD(P)-dependent oxidoreductase [Furfurilactobacillus sp. WILCCON 0119]|uniref:SDR family NAD(P)-dependent oxidoreductase n=1 Tax=Furfurilactobacillus entadae TaxID=2922307 RepID=UPI0035EDAEC6